MCWTNAGCAEDQVYPAGDCDCNGNVSWMNAGCAEERVFPKEIATALAIVLDACGVCGGTGVDVDGDGICDDIDNCTDTRSHELCR